jgi:hypothetical protein
MGQESSRPEGEVSEDGQLESPQQTSPQPPSPDKVKKQESIKKNVGSNAVNWMRPKTTSAAAYSRPTEVRTPSAKPIRPSVAHRYPRTALNNTLEGAMSALLKTETPVSLDVEKKREEMKKVGTGRWPEAFACSYYTFCCTLCSSWRG